MKYRKKPVVINAIQWHGSNLTEIATLKSNVKITEYETDFLTNELYIHTLEGKMKASIGDWIIQGVKGELYPCEDDIFKLTYEPVED